jgi:ABC-type transport system involved in multi-copper enzyme maturation permease subunit
MVLASTYLALSAAMSIAREREQGTLEVLFYGPIDDAAYVLGKFSTPLLACVAVIVLDVVWAWLFAYLSNFLFSFDLVPVAWLALCSSATLIAFSLLVSAATRSARAAMVTLLLAIGVVGAIQMGYDLLAVFAPPPEPNRVNPWLFMREVLDGLNRLTSWVSPYAYLNDGIESLVANDVFGYVRALGLSLLTLALYLGLAIRMMARRGVRG